MAEVIWSHQALNDLEEIGSFIEKVSFQYAQEQIKTLVEKAKQLEKYPLSGRPVPELNTRTIRQLLCGSLQNYL